MRARASTILAVGLLACSNDGGVNRADAGSPLAACEVNSDCIVVAESCCGSCGAPARGDAVAISRSRAAEHARDACKGNVGCPACAPLFIDPTLVATCQAGVCELVDLRSHAASACERDQDCRLRTPDCCECGGDTSLGRLLGISTSSERDYAELVCDPDQACPECAPIYPPEVTVECSASGRCETHDARLP